MNNDIEQHFSRLFSHVSISLGKELFIYFAHFKIKTDIWLGLSAAQAYVNHCSRCLSQIAHIHL